MTFSLAARCPETGMFGISIATSSIAVGNRCPWARASMGAVLTQHRTDIRLGPIGLDHLSKGLSARQTVDALVAGSEFPDLRQIGVIDREGNSGYEGKNCVSVGNAIANTDVPRGMVEAYEKATAEKLPFAERLLAAVDGGLAAGGETKPIMAAALLIVGTHSWPLVDLRVDWQTEPEKALRALWRQYEPQLDMFVTQVLRPHELETAP
ncbi:MAG: DUF1028 domain-containing protein [Alphaproteobacteria bacterium]|nr:DUF1028 domain-containing protein [Alphaproteobacteria bacterium]